MNEELLVPNAYFVNFKKFSDLLMNYKQLSASDIAKELGFSKNYIYQTIKAMLALDLIAKHGDRYSLTDKGREFYIYFNSNDKKRLKELGERIILNEKNSKLDFIKKAYQILKNNPRVTEFDLGNAIATELGIQWKTDSTYSKSGGSCKSILEGFNLLSKSKPRDLTLYETQSNNDELLRELHYDAGMFIFYVSNDENGWKNHLDLRQKVENKFNELINNQSNTATVLLLKESQRCFIRGILTKDIEELRHSLDSLYAIKINNLIK